MEGWEMSTFKDPTRREKVKEEVFGVEGGEPKRDQGRCPVLFPLVAQGFLGIRQHLCKQFGRGHFRAPDPFADRCP